MNRLSFGERNCLGLGDLEPLGDLVVSRVEKLESSDDLLESLDLVESLGDLTESLGDLAASLCFLEPLGDFTSLGDAVRTL